MIRLLGVAHRSSRDGARPRRIVKRVYLPTKPRLVTKIRTTVPDRMRRSNKRSLTRDVLVNRVYRVLGHELARPRHVTVIRDRLGACTVKSVTRTLVLKILPRRRTTGNGLSCGSVRLDDDEPTTGGGSNSLLSLALGQPGSSGKSIRPSPSLSRPSEHSGAAATVTTTGAGAGAGAGVAVAVGGGGGGGGDISAGGGGGGVVSAGGGGGGVVSAGGGGGGVVSAGGSGGGVTATGGSLSSLSLGLSQPGSPEPSSR